MDALDPASRSLLAEGRQLYVGVLTTSGPHVTPELYTADDRDVWFLTAADTVKTRVIRRDPRVSAVLRVGSRSLLLSGTVADYDIGDPLAMLRQSRHAVAALAALTSYTVRNAVDLTAFARDLATGRLPSRLPQRRILMRLRPDRSMLLDGTALVESQGSWPGRASAAADARALPGEVDCAVGVESDEAVLVLPGRTDAAMSAAAVPLAAVELGGLALETQLRGCVVVDDYRGPGPAAKRGELLRGTVRLGVDDGACRVEIEPDRDTTWTGAHTSTARV